MRRLLVPDLPPSGTAVVRGDEAHHLARVLRARVGESFALFDGRGREVVAVVESVGGSGVTLRIAGERDPARALRAVTLATAVPRGERMEWLVEKCTEAGVARVLPVAAARSVRDRASANVLRRWRRAAAEAAKQCGRADLPEIDEPRPLAEVLAATSAAARLVARPGAAAALADVLRGRADVALFVGPEGGFEPSEEAQLAAAGAHAFSLGPFVLRIETAALVAVHAAASVADGTPP